ncbi:hypothetical protein INR49_014554 [Caranx melampygus]|nr:hypothetical protein INR49_014554 [Caranx melampygus]
MGRRKDEKTESRLSELITPVTEYTLPPDAAIARRELLSNLHGALQGKRQRCQELQPSARRTPLP